MSVPFPTHLLRRACGGKSITYITYDPNGVLDGEKYDLAIQRNDPDDGTEVIWIKVTDGGNQNWI